MIKTNKRVTVDFDSESYCLDGEYWESLDNYGEEMAKNSKHSKKGGLL